MRKNILFIFLLASLLSSCSFSLNPSKKDNNENTQQKEDEDNKQDQEKKDNDIVHVSSVFLNASSINLLEGETYTLSASILPENAANKSTAWISTNNIVANVENGLVTALNAGSATITAATNDGNKTASCDVTVNKKNIEQETLTSSLAFNDLGYSSDNYNYTDSISITETIDVIFSKTNENQTAPSCIKGSNTKKYEARAYAGNILTFSSSDADLTKIEFVFSTDKPGTNEITASTGTFSTNIWEGNSKDVVFTVGGESGHRRISEIKVSYIGKSTENPDDFTNLGVKTIAEVKSYISEHPVKKNSFGNGVNEKTYVTIKGSVLARIDTIKETSNYGLNITYPAKVIIGDETDCIAVASKVGEGTLWNKVGDNVCKPESKYIVVGCISEIQGNPELKLMSFNYDASIETTWSPEILSKYNTTIEKFYAKANQVNYNCAGHGYGDVITISNITCFNAESDGQGKRYYNFTDGSKNIRINAFNLGSVSIGSSYDVTGIISLKNLSPIITALDIRPNSNVSPSLDYEKISTEISVANLRKIRGSQEDTNTRYPDVVNAFGTFFKTTGYLVSVEENGKVYYGLSDVYREDPITGKDNAKANYNVALIKNDNFWNTSYEESAMFNPYNDEYFTENKTITVYYVVRQLGYKENKAMWEIILVPSSIDSI